METRSKSAAGNRVMALDPATVEALRVRREPQAEHRAVVEPGWRTHQTDWRGQYRDELVFAWPDGSMLNPERYTAWFAKHCTSAALPRIRLHDVRYTYVSVALAQSTDWHEIKVISERLDHASIADMAGGGWSAGQYERYLCLAHGWAERLCVEADEVEYALFREGREPALSAEGRRCLLSAPRCAARGNHRGGRSPE